MDSTFTSFIPEQRNEIDISVTGMNDIIFNKSKQNINIGYKRFINGNAIRFNLYVGNNGSLAPYTGITFINDSLYALKSMYLEQSIVGIKTGWENDLIIYMNSILILGCDLNLASISKTTSFNIERYRKTKNIKLPAYFGGGPSDWSTKYGLNLGLSPVIGLSYYFTPSYSATALLVFDCFYEKYQGDLESSIIVLNESIKLSFNVSF